jgi:hypothetical protein
VHMTEQCRNISRYDIMCDAEQHLVGEARPGSNNVVTLFQTAQSGTLCQLQSCQTDCSCLK